MPSQDDEHNLIYIPPNIDQSQTPPISLRFLTDKFVVNLKEKELGCVDCEAKSHLHKLYDIDGSCISLKNFNVIQDALIFVLENTDWPINDGH